MTREVRGVSLALAVAATAAGRAGDEAADADLGRMGRLAASVRLADIGSGEPRPLVAGRPLLRFTDPDRGIRDGTLWAWGGTGRPAAVAEVYQKHDEPGDWHLAFSASASGGLTADLAGSRIWSPAAVEGFRAIPNLRPHESADARLRQMKAIARSFTGYEVFDPDRRRSELRLLPNPLLRYDASEAGLIDGALFVLAMGTNPEVLLFVEARREGPETAWRYAAVRRGYAEMRLLRDDREVWRCDRVWETRPDQPMHEIVVADPAPAPRP